MVSMVNLASYLDRSVLEYPENIAVEESGRQVEYGEYGRMAENLAGYLSGLGIARNDRM